MTPGLLILIAQLNCDPAYPKDVNGKRICIPSPPPDLDCKYLTERAGIYVPVVVKAPDPHKLDKDKDGLGCES